MADYDVVVIGAGAAGLSAERCWPPRASGSWWPTAARCSAGGRWRCRTRASRSTSAAGCAERVLVADPGRPWRVRVAAGLSTVGDEELLRRAVGNLLMNVLVHTPHGTAGAKPRPRATARS